MVPNLFSLHATSLTPDSVTSVAHIAGPPAADAQGWIAFLRRSVTDNLAARGVNVGVDAKYDLSDAECEDIWSICFMAFEGYILLAESALRYLHVLESPICHKHNSQAVDAPTATTLSNAYHTVRSKLLVVEQVYYSDASRAAELLQRMAPLFASRVGELKALEQRVGAMPAEMMSHLNDFRSLMAQTIAASRRLDCDRELQAFATSRVGELACSELLPHLMMGREALLQAMSSESAMEHYARLCEGELTPLRANYLASQAAAQGVNQLMALLTVMLMMRKLQRQHNGNAEDTHVAACLQRAVAAIGGKAQVSNAELLGFWYAWHHMHLYKDNSFANFARKLRSETFKEAGCSFDITTNQQAYKRHNDTYLQRTHPLSWNYQAWLDHFVRDGQKQPSGSNQGYFQRIHTAAKALLLELNR